MSLSLGSKVRLIFELNLIDTNKEEVRDIKAKAFKNPGKLLYPKLGKKYE